MQGWDKPDPTDGSNRLKGQGVGEVAANQVEGESLEWNIKNVYLDPLSLDYNPLSSVPEFDVPSGQDPIDVISYQHDK